MQTDCLPGQTTPFGYSPCPNDTFMFYAWSQAKIASQLAIEPRLSDIQELNRQAISSHPLPFTKISAALYPRIKSDYTILSAGAALGIGCGPLIVGHDRGGPLNGRKLAHPGIHTTAYQLTRMALALPPEQLVEMRYDEILPAVLSGQVGAGVIIHESRFVYQGLGLSCLLDLGNWWEKKTGLPLPLGIMVAKRDIADPVLREAEHSLQRSIDFAWQNSDQAWQYIKENATEIDDSTIRSHIELYVNDWSRDLGSKGSEALQVFFELCA